MHCWKEFFEAGIKEKDKGERMEMMEDFKPVIVAFCCNF
jgi:hypothetical protein